MNDLQSCHGPTVICWSCHISEEYQMYEECHHIRGDSEVSSSGLKGHSLFVDCYPSLPYFVRVKQVTDRHPKPQFPQQ
jgi:hypothetical protein